jgi:threonine aldolase
MIPTVSPTRIALRAGCTRFLSGHGRSTARAWLERLASSPYADLALDEYSDGPAISLLEGRVAALLGKPAALWFPKGVTAQQVALLVHADASGSRVVALHPKSHLAFDEQDALDRLAALLPRRVGLDHRPFTRADLDGVRERLAALTVELPLRRAAFQAPDWDELVAMAAWARDRGIPFHIDGARIWEVAPWYGRTLADIAALADTIYVSFYKGLGGLGGCVLAGPAEFIAAAKPWRNRYGGDLAVGFPFIISALDGLDTHLPRMAAYHAHARAIAAALIEAGLTAHPEAPHGNSFQVHFPVSAAALTRAAHAVAAESQTWLFGRISEGALPRQSITEIAVGEATLGWSADEVATTLLALREAARASDPEMPHGDDAGTMDVSRGGAGFAIARG